MFDRLALRWGLVSFLTLVLALFLAASQSWGQENLPAASQNQEPAVAVLDSSEKATTFAHELAHRAQELKDRGLEQVVVYWHIEGERPSPQLEELLLQLHHQGVPVLGRTITVEDLERQIDATEDFLVPALDASGSRLSLKERLKKWRATFFGTPFGITFLQHYFKLGKDSKFTRAAPANQDLQFSGQLNALATTSWFYVASVLAPHLSHGSSLLPSKAFVTAAAALYGWVYFFWDFAVETASFKTQAKKVEIGQSSIQFKSRRRFYVLSTLGQGLVLNFMLLSLVVGPEHLTAPMATNAFWNAFLTTFAFAPMEKWFSESRLRANALRAEAARVSDQETKERLLAEADRISRRATRSFNAYMMVFLPLIKNAHLFLSQAIPGWGAIAAMVPLVTVGTLGFGLDIRTNSPDFVAKMRRRLGEILRGAPERPAPAQNQGRLFLLPRAGLCEMAFL